MSDSVDRVFVHALATVRRLPRTGSSRPPPSARLQLYGLYKQSMEGDVSTILPRPSLPPPSPEPVDTSNVANNSVHRYASRDLRTREAQAEIEKWDAWHACAGMSKTEAKRRYITTLIETMKEYASGTAESRELVSELEFVWNQIKSQSGSDQSEEGESPTRRLERAGLKRMTLVDTSLGPGDGGGGGGGDGNSNDNVRRGLGSGPIFGRIGTETNSAHEQTSRLPVKHHGLRVLSPISQRSIDGIVENEELLPQPDADEDEDEDEDDDDDDENYASASEDKLDGSRQHGQHDGVAERRRQRQQHRRPPSPSSSRPDLSSPDSWRAQIESHLRHLTTELAALREQLSSSHMLSRSTFSFPTHLSLRRRALFRISMWARWLFWTTVRQACIQLGLLVVVVIWGRIRGDRRVENWCRERLKELTSLSRHMMMWTADSEVMTVADKLRVLQGR